MNKRAIPLLAPPFDSYSPEDFHAYAKSLEKPWKPKAVKDKKTKTRKKKSNDNNPGPKSNSKEAQREEKNDGDIGASGRTDAGINKFFIAVGN